MHIKKAGLLKIYIFTLFLILKYTSTSHDYPTKLSSHNYNNLTILRGKITLEKKKKTLPARKCLNNCEFFSTYYN